jgi:hypothetical protein
MLRPLHHDTVNGLHLNKALDTVLKNITTHRGNSACLRSRLQSFFPSHFSAVALAAVVIRLSRPSKIHQTQQITVFPYREYALTELLAVTLKGRRIRL